MDEIGTELTVCPPYFMYLSIGSNKVINLTEISPHIRPHNIDHTRYFRHAPARLRVDANMFALAYGYAAVCLLVQLRTAEGATQAGCGVRLVVRGYRSATSTHETISSSIEPLLSLSGVNLWAQRYRLC